MYTVDYEGLNDLLDSLSPNTVDTPYQIKITNPEDDDPVYVRDFVRQLGNHSNIYVDLSPTICHGMQPYPYGTFTGIETLVISPVVSDDSIYIGYGGCINLKKITNIPSAAQEIFVDDCSSLTDIPAVPNGVTQFDCRYCTNLKTIHNWGVDFSEEVQRYFNFTDCPSLEAIYTVPKESDEWHVLFLKFGADTVEGSVYDVQGNEVLITQKTIDKTKIIMPIYTDELWFPDASYTDTQVKEIIENMILYGYGIFNKEVLPPDQKSFVLWKDETSNFVSNIDFGGNNGLPVGFVGAYYGTTDPDGWFICDGRDTAGTDIELETNFPLLYDFLGSNVLPDLRKRFIEGADNDVGTYVSPGIPNITGTTQHVQYMGGASGSGAFSRGDSSSNNSAYNGNTTKTQRLSFNAKNGETKTDGTLKGANDTKVYGESNTVQPASLRLNYIIKAK